MEIDYRMLTEVYRGCKKDNLVRCYKVGNYEVGFLNGENEYMAERSAEDYGKVKEWCWKRLLPYMTRRSINPLRTSYGLKHIAENELGFYVCNAEIKLALAELGVRHGYGRQVERINHYYPLSENFYRDLQKREVSIREK